MTASAKKSNAMTVTNIVLFQDSQDIAERIENELLRHENLRLLESVSDIQNIDSLLADTHPDVVLMDLQLREHDETDRSGIEGIQKIKTFDPEITVIVLSAHKDKETIKEAVNAGADAYFHLGSFSIVKLAAIIEGVRNQNLDFPPEIKKMLMNKS